MISDIFEYKKIYLDFVKILTLFQEYYLINVRTK